MDLIINYDPEADVLVLKLREGLVVNEELLDNDPSWAMMVTGGPS
jgi:hypothetical protein